MKRRRTNASIGLVFLVVLITLFLSAAVPASAADGPGHTGWPPPVTENPDTDSAHGDSGEKGDVNGPSGKGRPGEEGESGEEGLDGSTPDRDGQGPKRDEREKNKPKGREDEEIADQHEGKDCRKDGDFEDDSEGRCREPEKPKVRDQQPKVRDQQPKVRDQKLPSGEVSDTSGTPPVDAEEVPGRGSEATNAPGEERTNLIGVRASAALQGRAPVGSRLFLSDGTTLGGAQPSLAIVVNALNDADGDGIYSDSEIAPAAGADISFKAVISNNGVTPFEIVSVSHTFAEPSGRVQVEVCGDLGGLKVASEESLACSFSVSDYSPPLGESVVNSVSASAIEVGGSGRRGTSDSDNSTVATLLGDEVLASVVQRVPGPLAFTGTDAARLVALALVLLAAGGGLIVLARVRAGRPGDPVLRTSPWIRLPGWRSTPSVKPPPLHKISRR